MKRNSFVDFWRIFFTYCIAVYHLKNTYGQDTSLYLAVEFFFILSGFLLYRSIDNNREGNAKSAWQYTFDKIKRLYPHCLFSYLVFFVAKNVLSSGINFSHWFNKFIKHIPEMLLLWPLGLNKERSWPYAAAPWYLAVLFVAGYFLYWLLLNYEKITSQFIAPLSVVLVYTWFYRSFGSMHHGYMTEGIISSYLLRGWTDMCLGVLMYSAFKYYSEKNITVKKVTAAICCLVGLLVYFVVALNSHREGYDFAVLPAMAVIVLLSFLVEETSSEKKINVWIQNIISFLAKLSFPIYMNHQLFRMLDKYFIDEYNFVSVAVYLISVTIYSFFTLKFVDFVMKVFTNKNKLKR